MAKVTKAVIPAAGFGTRFLPQTKAMPKEMLPLIDKPIIQYIVEGLVEAGITDIIIVGSANKRSIEDHFDDPAADLLENLRAGGDKKQRYIDEIQKISGLANFLYVRQKGPYGTGTPLMNAAHAIGDEPFIYVYTDDLIRATPNAYKQLIDFHEELGGNIIACMPVRNDVDYDRFGIVAGDPVRDGVLRMNGIVEQPGKEHATSNSAVIGGYVFTPDILNYIEKGLTSLPADKEFRLNEYIMAPMARDGHPFYAVQLQNSVYYDTGDKLGYLKTVVDMGLQHDELGPEFRDYLCSRLDSGQV